MQCCRDVSPFIRKLSVDSLSQIYLKAPEFHEEYIEGIFPLTADNEASVQEKALCSVKETIFNAITSKKRERLGWHVLSNLGECCLVINYAYS